MALESYHWELLWGKRW